MILPIHELPKAIANQQHALHLIDRQIRSAQTAYHRLLAEIDTAIAFDKTLTNDTQRKAKRQELSENDEFQAASVALELLKDQHAIAEIELTYLENEFLVAQLEKRANP